MIPSLSSPGAGKIAAHLEKLSGASLAVLGDFCLDGYWVVDRETSELSLETGLATEPIRSQRYAPGGAGNVVMNLAALKIGKIFPVGVLGEDPFGRELLRLFDDPSIDPQGLVFQGDGWSTHAYIKPYLGTQELNRLDHGNFNRLSRETENLFFNRLEAILAQVSVVLINHQTIGSVHDNPGFRERLLGVIRRHPQIRFILDSRGYHESYRETMHKLNDREVLRSCGHPVESVKEITEELLLQCMHQLHADWKSPLVVTRGEHGCLVMEGESIRQVLGVQLEGPIDPVGAGDTFVSALAAFLAAGVELGSAAVIANLAAALTVQKLFQTGTVTREEILQLAKSERDF